MEDVIGYFLTWTTYGTWLPGDERGWHDWRQGWHPADRRIAEYARSTMTEEAVILNDAQRKVVEATIEKHCQIRNWHLWARNCRTNHVHVVVTASSYDGETVRGQNLGTRAIGGDSRQFDTIKSSETQFVRVPECLSPSVSPSRRCVWKRLSHSTIA